MATPYTCSTSPCYSIQMRLEIDNVIGKFAQIATAIGVAGGNLGAVDIVRVERGKIVRDITVDARDAEHEKAIANAIKAVGGVRVLKTMDRTFSSHEGGKIEIRSKVQIRDRNDLSQVYTPGVARVCMDIHHNPEHVYRYTIKRNTVAIITDGTAVLGLGDIGPDAAMPVMEGKAMIFKEFADIDAFPIALRTKDPDAIVETVRNIATPFGGINLEDISAPRCFDIETRLRKALPMPVIHDDQHGTAVVVLSALINVGRLIRKDVRKFKVAMVGAGAAGTAIAKILLAYGIKDITVCDSKGTVYPGRRTGMNPHLAALAKLTNPRRLKGTISDAMAGANVFIGVSAPNVIAAKDIKRMAKDPVVFALANPDPEIAPDEALPLVKVLATGRSDFPNQINNMLSYPGIFRGLLDVHAKGVNEEVKLAAAEAIAHMVKAEELHEDYIIPSPFERRVVHAVAHAVSEAARKTGLAER
jgi:malate dehydrogenase (oxaloacetate-decarboxylating)